MKMDIRRIQEIGTEMLSCVAEICEKHGITYFAGYGTVLGAVRHHAPIPWDADIDIYVPENQMKLFIDTMRAELPEKYWIHDATNGNHPRCFPRIGLAGYKTETLHIDVFRLTGAPNDEKEQKKLMKKGRRLFVEWKAKAVDPDHYYRTRRGMRIKAKLLRFALLPVSMDSILKKIDRLCGQYGYEGSDLAASPLHGSMKHIFPKSMLGKGTKEDYCGFPLVIPEDYEAYLKKLYGDYMTLPPEEERNAGLNRTFNIRELEK